MLGCSSMQHPPARAEKNTAMVISTCFEGSDWSHLRPVWSALKPSNNRGRTRPDPLSPAHLEIDISTRTIRARSAARHLQIDVDVWRQISDLPELTGNSRSLVGVS